MLTAVRLHLQNQNNVSSDGIFRVLPSYVIWAYFIILERDMMTKVLYGKKKRDNVAHILYDIWDHEDGPETTKG